MKKRKFALLLLFVLLLLPAASCAQSYETLCEITKEDTTYALLGVGDTPKKISVIRGGYVIRSLDVHPDASVGNENGCYGFYVEDANFDGMNDLILAIKKDGEVSTYDVYLAGGDGNDFSRSHQLSSLKNIRVRPEYQAVFGFDQTKTDEGGGHYSLTDKATKYVWVGGKLRPDVYAALTYYSKADLYCYSTAVYDASAGAFDPPKDRWLTPEEYKTTDFDFLYYYKAKVNTTK